MHRSGAQFAYRLGFVLLCLIPTFAVIGWVVTRSLPGFVLSEKQEWERELSRRLGMRVTCVAVSYPRHDTAELTSVAFADLETGVPLAQIGRLEFERATDRWKITGWQVIVDAGQLPQLREQLEDHFLRLPGEEISRGELALKNLTLQHDQQSYSLVDVVGQWDANERGPLTQWQFRLPEAERGSAPAMIFITRNRDTIPPSTRWQFSTGELPLPCALLASVAPELRPLGKRATFVGQLDAIQTGPSLSGNLRGSLQNIDLNALVTEQLSHQVSGFAACHIEDATIQDSRLVLLRGTLQARDGSVSPSLLMAASEHMNLAVPLADRLPERNAPVSFRHLALGFELRDTGLRLTGSADLTREGVLISCAAGSLLEAPREHQVEPLALVRALSPAREWQVSAARPAQALARWLPMSQPANLNTAALPTQHIPTRLLPAINAPTPAVRQPQ